MYLHEFDLPFLDSRPYLHGTTLLEAILNLFEFKYSIEYRISKPIFVPTVKIQRLQELPTPAENTAAHLVFSNENDQLIFGVWPVDKGNEKQFVLSFEKEIVKTGKFMPKTVSLNQSSGFSWVKVVVFLAKELLCRSIKLPPGEQWLFVGLDLDEIPSVDIPYHIELSSTLAHNRLVTLTVQLGNSSGKILFSRAKKLIS